MTLKSVLGYVSDDVKNLLKKICDYEEGEIDDDDDDLSIEWPNFAADQSISSRRIKKEIHQYLNLPSSIINGMREVTFLDASFLADNNNFVHVYTDGSVTQRASFAAWFGPHNPMNYCTVVVEPFHQSPDINVAELMGIHKAIQIANSKGVKNINIYTDSKNAIRIINKGINHRKKAASTKTYKKCPQIIEDIINFNASMKIKLIKVKSHYKKKPCIGNDEADALCDVALQKIGCGKIKKRLH